MSEETPQWLQQARDKWVHRGQRRPPFAATPGPGQESVWDYPRPPAVVADSRTILVTLDDHTLASSPRSVRILETSHPPTFYVPPDAVNMALLEIIAGTSHCEWKGAAEYLGRPGTTEALGWRYPTPYPEFAEYADWVAFYPGRVKCHVDGEVVRAQAGGFYGGWITDDVVGPFKGEPGTSGW